jgi:hypothetical protein
LRSILYESADARSHCNLFPSEEDVVVEAKQFLKFLLADSAASVCNPAAEILSFTEVVFFGRLDELISSVGLFLIEEKEGYDGEREVE